MADGVASAERAYGIQNTERLEERTNIKGWAQWHQSGTGAHLGYAASVWQKGVPSGFRTSRVNYPITDDDAIAIEKIVARMQVNHPCWATILIEHYVRHKSLRELARIIGCDKNAVAALRDNALVFLLAKLDRA